MMEGRTDRKTKTKSQKARDNNHATTNLAIYSNETPHDKLSNAFNRKSIIIIKVQGKLHENLLISLKQ